MELLFMKTKLEKGIADPKEREETKKRIKILEKELGID